MKNIIYSVLAVLLLLPSCAQEDPRGPVVSNVGGRIYFRSYVPSISESRAAVISKENLLECHVTCLNPDDERLINPLTGAMTPYFSDIRFVKDLEDRFIASESDSCLWPDASSRLRFFAYYPSVENMRQSGSDDMFSLVNKSVCIDGDTILDYRIEKFRVDTLISRQVDFIAAYTSASLQENGDTGIELDFSHQLARVEISAWGDNEKYDFEIAGVRIGNPIIQGDFNFASLLPDTLPAPAWTNTAGNQAPVEHIFSAGDKIVILSRNADSHTSADESASIMGSGGAAMVIPMDERIERWEGKQDPSINVRPYHTDRLYFSVLLRVRNLDDQVVFPYPNDRDGMKTVYLAVSPDGTVMRRVYKIDGEYYTANEKNEDNRYLPRDAEEIRAFCWAALPVAAKWEAGKIYRYKLNYSSGIGWEDPDDPHPGEPIIERGSIPFEVSVAGWLPAEGHNPNINVPKR